jgi:hypothetical protein
MQARDTVIESEAGLDARTKFLTLGDQSTSVMERFFP